MVANQVILSSIWYFASCMDFSNQALNLVRATVRNYIWSGKREGNTRARVKWATAILPIVRGGVKIIDPNWQTSALLIKLLIRGLSVGYEPWKTLVRHRVAQTRQSRRGKWPNHSNWIMNNHPIVKQGSPMWQGIMRAWNSIQSGMEQQDPTTWTEIMRQPLYGNRLLTNELGIQWGTEPRSNMLWWPGKGLRAIKDIIKREGQGWKDFQELPGLRRTRVAPPLYNRLVRSIPWEATPRPPHSAGMWLAEIEGDGNIHHVYHLHRTDPMEATFYRKENSERLIHVGTQHQIPEWAREVRVIRTIGPQNIILDYNPRDETPEEQTLWVWGNTWIEAMEWDPKDWQWRRIGILPDTPILNYSTKRGYRIALKQENHQMKADADLEAAGYDGKARAKFWNIIWHPYLPRKVSALQWLILTDGLPVGSWREKLGLNSACQLCVLQERETSQHAFLDCEEIQQAWHLFRTTRAKADLQSAYHTWAEISRGLLTDPGVLVSNQISDGIPPRHSQLIMKPPGTCCEPSCYGPYGAKDSPTHSTTRGFTWGWSYGTPGGILSTQQWRLLKSCTDIKKTKKRDRSKLLVSNKSGLRLTSSVG